MLGALVDLRKFLALGTAFERTRKNDRSEEGLTAGETADRLGVQSPLEGPSKSRYHFSLRRMKRKLAKRAEREVRRSFRSRLAAQKPTAPSVLPGRGDEPALAGVPQFKLLRIVKRSLRERRWLNYLRFAREHTWDRRIPKFAWVSQVKDDLRKAPSYVRRYFRRMDVRTPISGELRVDRDPGINARHLDWLKSLRKETVDPPPKVESVVHPPKPKIVFKKHKLHGTVGSRDRSLNEAETRRLQKLQDERSAVAEQRAIVAKNEAAFRAARSGKPGGSSR